jgi:hypothetical protein
MTELKEEILTSHDMLLPRPRNDGAEGGDSHVARYAPPSPLTSLYERGHRLHFSLMT